MSKTLYMVTRGEYSDYCVLGVFSNKERAEQYKKAVAADNEIEEIELDPEDDKIHYPDGYQAWEIEMDNEGNVISNDNVDIRSAYNNNSPYHSRKMNCYIFTAVGATLEHAIKIVNERRAQMIANNEWIASWDVWYGIRYPSLRPLTKEERDENWNALFNELK
jgi:hypothetical protein